MGKFILLNRIQRLRANGLLNMEYTPSELAAELGVKTDIVYRGLIPNGCPHRRDENGHLWLIGTAVADWLRHQEKTRHPLADGEAWCLRCNQPVKMLPPLTVTPTNRYLELVSATCPQCGTRINRARARQTLTGESNDQSR